MMFITVDVNFIVFSTNYYSTIEFAKLFIKAFMLRNISFKELIISCYSIIII